MAPAYSLSPHHFRQNAVNGLLVGDVVGGQLADGGRLAGGFPQQAKGEGVEGRDLGAAQVIGQPFPYFPGRLPVEG